MEAYKWNEWDFKGKHAYTLQPYNGKVHDQNFEFGLFDFPEKDLETFNCSALSKH